MKYRIHRDRVCIPGFKTSCMAIWRSSTSGKLAKKRIYRILGDVNDANLFLLLPQLALQIFAHWKKNLVLFKKNYSNFLSRKYQRHELRLSKCHLELINQGNSTSFDKDNIFPKVDKIRGEQIGLLQHVTCWRKNYRFIDMPSTGKLLN